MRCLRPFLFTTPFWFFSSCKAEAPESLFSEFSQGPRFFLSMLNLSSAAVISLSSASFSLFRLAKSSLHRSSLSHCPSWEIFHLLCLADISLLSVRPIGPCSPRREPLFSVAHSPPLRSIMMNSYSPRRRIRRPYKGRFARRTTIAVLSLSAMSLSPDGVPPFNRSFFNRYKDVSSLSPPSFSCFFVFCFFFF